MASNVDEVNAQLNAMEVEPMVEDEDGDMLIEDEGEDLGENYLEEEGSIDDGGDDGTVASLEKVEEQLAMGVDQPFKREPERDDAVATLGCHTDSVYCCANDAQICELLSSNTNMEQARQWQVSFERNVQAGAC